MENTLNDLISGCVILYNPNAIVIDNIITYIDKLHILYVVDNSDKHNEGVIKQLLALSNKVIYVDNGGNIGIATALNKACNLACNAGYKWMLTMDQDSFFSDTSFFELIGNKNNPKVAIYAASYTNEYDRWVKEFDLNFDEVHYLITSANVLSLNAWKHVNGFEDKLFIDEVDHDFCLKLRKLNYVLLSSKQLFLQHAVGEISETSVKIKPKLNLHQPIRYYYIARNGLYICKKYFFSDINFALKRLFYLLKAFVKIILLYPDKLRYLKFYFTGVKDFFLSRYGKLR